MTVIKSEIQNNSTEWKAIKPGLYVARIENVELKESKKWQSEELEEKLVVCFGLLGTYGSNKPVADVEGETFLPLRRKVFKWCNTKHRYAWSGAIELTQTGNLLEAVGFKDVTEMESYDTDELEGKILVVKIDNKKNDHGELKDRVDDFIAFDGDDKQVDEWLEMANSEQEVEDVAYEDAGK